jgi:hypothetical protein
LHFSLPGGFVTLGFSIFHKRHRVKKLRAFGEALASFV